MSTWTAPITWANGAVTAATMNTEVRDHLNFLKGSLDLVTNSTTADTGTATYLRIVRTGATDQVIDGQVTGDTIPRIRFRADGYITWGPGGAGALDVTLYRQAADKLRTDDLFESARAATGDSALGTLVTGDTTSRLVIRADGHHTWGDGTAAGDVTLFRQAANRLRSEDIIESNRGATTDDAFYASVSTEANPRFVARADGLLSWGPGSAAADTNLYRSGVDKLKTDAAFEAVDSISTNGGTLMLHSSGYLEGTEMIDPAAPAANFGRLYFRDNGVGKTQLVVRFNTGAVQVLATEP